jgi:hypothetical protein
MTLPPITNHQRGHYDILVGKTLISADVIFHHAEGHDPWAAVSVDLGERDYCLGPEENWPDDCPRLYMTFRKSKYSQRGHVRCYFHAYWSDEDQRWYIERPECLNPDPYQCYPGVGFWDEDDPGDGTGDPVAASKSTEKAVGDCLLAILRRLPHVEKPPAHRSIDELWDW